jgi:aminoglycoside phosphotransferase (APT) family kinase protein
LRELQQFTAPNAQTVDGGLLDDRIIGACSTIPKCKKMGSTTEKWFENIAEQLRAGISKTHKTTDSALIELELQKMNDKFPNPEPFVLTHGDLTFGNIMVKDDKITAIIDWEYTGYHPWWAECWIHCNYAHDGSHDL